MERCQAWAKNASPERDWVIKHGLRTLIKDSHAGALGVIGLGTPKELEVEFLLEPFEIKIGESVELSLSLTKRASSQQKLAIDYAVEFVRKGGKRNQKVFKGKILELASGENETWHKKHPMKVTTVRALYLGKHRVLININGHTFAEGAFEMTPE